MPVYVPEPVAIEPMPTHDELHVPPVGAPVMLIVLPSHTCAPAGVMLVGRPFTNTTVVREQPDTAYVIVVVPAPRPVTTPPVDIVPTAGLLLLQVPPVVALLSVVV
jgi:hypothetical protein